MHVLIAFVITCDAVVKRLVISVPISALVCPTPNSKKCALKR